MQKKIFITTEIPDDIKDAFRREESRWKNLNVFWTGFSHVHLTMEYLGVVDNVGLRKIKQALEETIEEMREFDIRLDRIVLGPNEKEPTMFWATIYEDDPVRFFRRTLREHLAENKFELTVADFKPHIVLAKANGNQLKGKQTSVRLRGKMRIEEFNLFSSQTYAKGTTKYKLVESYPLSK
jgi:2'-5' RNA ligase